MYRFILKFCLIVCFAFMVTACHTLQWHDPTLEKQKDDFQQLAKPVKGEDAALNTPPVDLGRSVILEPQKRITLQAQRIPLSTVLEGIAHQAKISLMTDGSLGTPVTYYATNRPLEDVLEDLGEMQGLVFELQHNILKVKKDKPYFKQYYVPFLSVSRSMENQTALNTNIFTSSNISGGSSSGSGTENGSSSKLISKNTANFWEEVEDHLAMILNVKVAPQEKSMVPVSDGYKSTYSSKEKRRPYAIHKQSGIISVYATHAKHKFVEKFLDNLRHQTQTQILIEAKVVEVALREEFKSGIDWEVVQGSRVFQGYDLLLNAKMGGLANASSPLGRDLTPLGIGVDSRKLDTILSLLESFGTTRTLSSPRITVMNNQSAVMKVAENQVFFKVSYDKQYLNRDNTNVGLIVGASSTIQTIPIGLVMTVQPSINGATQEITLSLRPTISRIIGFQEDPSVQIANNALGDPTKQVKSEVPIVAIREMDSILRIKSGEIAILGGLMVEAGHNQEAGLPIGSGTWNFFTKGQRKNNSLVELVIFLKATIVNTSPVTPADKRVYAHFTRDPRPFT